MTVAPREISTPRESSLVYWMGWAAACAAYLAIAEHSRWWAWLILAFFVLVAVLEYCGRNIPPVSLVLDSEGFAIAGGLLRRKPQKILWRDIETFCVMDLPRPQYGRRQCAVGFRYSPETRRAREAAGMINRLAGVDGWIPIKWPRPHDAIVEELNAYREMALQARAERVHGVYPDTPT